MLVGVNTLTIEPGESGGEELYLRSVLAHMGRLQPATRFLIFTDSRNHDSFDGWERLCVGPYAGDDISGFRGLAARLGRAAAEAGVDLLFSSLAKAPAKPSVPLALYVMELRDIAAPPEGARRRESSQVKSYKNICASATAILTPSQFMQRELLAKLDVPMNQSVVTPLGIDAVLDQPQPCPAQQPYLLTVGNTHAHKNIPRLMEAYLKIAEEFPHSLVVVGRPKEAELKDWGPRVIRIDRFPKAQLAGLYQHCALFVCASLYEGSGVLVQEAMRAGASIATGRVGGIPEVAGNAPLYFNSESVSSMVSVIRRGLTETDAERVQRLKAGRALSAEYTWESCAWKTLAAFKRA